MFKRLLLLSMILLLGSAPVNAGSQADITKEEVYDTIRNNFMARNTEFTIIMSANTLQEIGTDTDILQEVSAIDNNTSKDGDYLDVTVLRWSENWKYDDLGNAIMTMSVTYRTTQEQEKVLDEKIESVLTLLKLEEATDYEKVKAIHDYIIKNVSFDQTLQKYTAYSALIKESAVCEGYAAAAYRLFTDAGLKSRIMAGTANGEAHIWNIVKVDGKWYNIDLTWDDPDNNNQIYYDYFLKNADEFSDHIRNPEFITEEFLKAYPIAEESY